eukprot:scaffold11875_cov132-Isochrysis_galbana.AAC.4
MHKHERSQVDTMRARLLCPGFCLFLCGLCWLYVSIPRVGPRWRGGRGRFGLCSRGGCGGGPTDDTEAREQDAPDTTGAKHRAPLHGHTGAVPPDKALSDTCTNDK